MNRMVPIIAALLLAATPAENEAALADRARFPVAEHGLIYYVSTSHLPGEAKDKCEAALAYTVAASSKQPLIDKCTPQQVQDGLYRLHLGELQWDWRQWHVVVKPYPYMKIPGALPLIIRGDWLVVQLADGTQSDAYMRLLYGREKITRNEYLAFWGVNNDVSAAFGVIAEKEAGSPNVAPVRWIENRPTKTRGSAWGTRDSAEIDLNSDPLQHLDGKFAHQAEEWLTAMPKINPATGEQGMLLAPLLSNAKGEQQTEAPPSIVTDHHGFRGQKAIRFPGGCVSCHTVGINPPSVNEFRKYVAAGVDIYAKPKALQEQLDLFHGTAPGKQIKRDQEDFAAALKAINALDGELNSLAFNDTIDAYDGQVTLETAAAELHCEPKELRLALAYASNGGARLGARLAGLAHDLPMPRATWEQTYYQAYVALQAWRTSK